MKEHCDVITSQSSSYVKTRTDFLKSQFLNWNLLLAEESCIMPDTHHPLVQQRLNKSNSSAQILFSKINVLFYAIISLHLLLSASLGFRYGIHASILTYFTYLYHTMLFSKTLFCKIKCSTCLQPNFIYYFHINTSYKVAFPSLHRY
jgi:hypothetical protein